MITRLLTLAFFCLSGGLALAQSHRISEIFALKQRLAKTSGNQDSARLLLQLGDTYMPLNLDSAQYYLEMSIELAEKLPPSRLTGNALLAYADLLAIRADPMTEDYYNRALNIYRKAGLKEAEVEVICRICTFGGTHPRDYYIQYLLQTLELMEEQMTDRQKGYVLYVLGKLYARENKLLQAERAFTQSLELHLQVEYSNPAGLISELGNVYYHQGLYNKALTTYQKALPYLQKEDDQIGYGYILCNIALAQEELGLYDFALNNLRSSLQSRVNANEHIGLKYTYLEMSQLFLKRNEPEMAREWLLKAQSADSASFLWEEAFTRALIARQVDSLPTARRLIDSLMTCRHEVATDRFDLLLMKVEVLLLQNDLDGADAAMAQVIAFTESLDNHSLRARAALMNAQLWVQKNRLEKSIKILQNALLQLKTEESPVTAAEIMGYLALYLNDAGRSQEAIEMLHRLKLFSDTVQRDKNFRLSGLATEFDLQLKQNQLNQLGMRQKRQFLLLSALGVLIVLVLVYAIKQRRLKKKAAEIQRNTREQYERTLREKDENLEEQAEDKTREMLEQRDRELAAKALQMAQQNELLDFVKKQLNNVEKRLEGDIRMELRNTVKNLEGSTVNRNDWENFSAYFERVHPGFFSKVSERYPKLTSEDLRYCAYLKSNMSNREIAELLHINVESVRVHKYRLKKKMELPKEVDLTTFIRGIG